MSIENAADGLRCDMTAPPEHPLRSRAALRAEIYRLTIRARQTPARHPLRLYIARDLAELQAELTEIEQYIGGILPPRTSTLAAAPQADPFGDRPPAADPASVAGDHTGHTGSEEPRPGWMILENQEPGVPSQERSTASIGAWYRRAIIRPLHRAGVVTAHGAADVSRAVQQLLETVGDSVIAFGVLVIRAPNGVARQAGEAFRFRAALATRKCRRAGALTQQRIAGALRLLWQTLDAGAMQFAAVLRRSVSNSSARVKALLGSGLVAAVILRRLAGAVTGRCITACISLLHRSTQIVVATTIGLWRAARVLSLRASEHMGAFFSQCRLAADQGVRRAHTAAREGFETARRLLLQRVAPAASRWAERFRRAVVIRIGDGLRAGTGAGRRAAERTAAAAKRGLTRCGLFLQKVIEEAPGKGRELSTACQQLTARISDRSRQAIAVRRPAVIQALRNVQTAAMRSAARSQQVTREWQRTARAKWATVCRHAVLARAAMGRRAGSAVRAGVQSSIAAGRQTLQKAIPAAQITFEEISTLSRRLTFRITDHINEGARRLASLRAADQSAPGAAHAFGGATRIPVDDGNAGRPGDTIAAP